MPKFNEYTEKTNPDDVDIFLLQDAASTRKISFLNIFNRIKTKLGLGELATKSKVAQSDLEAALANLIAGKLTSSGIANNLTTTDTTKVLAAPQGKALLESITSALTLIGSLDALTTTEKTNLVGSINELVTSLTALNSNLNEPKTRTIEGAYVNMQVTTFGKFVWVRIAGYPKTTMKQGQEYTLFRPTTNTPMYGIYRRININPTAGFVFQMSSVDAETSITPFGGDLTSTSGINVSECYIMK